MPLAAPVQSTTRASCNSIGADAISVCIVAWHCRAGQRTRIARVAHGTSALLALGCILRERRALTPLDGIRQLPLSGATGAMRLATTGVRLYFLCTVTRWQTLQNASAELRALLAAHDELRRAEAQEVVQNWVDAQHASASPEVLCARLVKALTDVAALCRAQSEQVRETDLRAALREALGVPAPR